jgi:hypothetical protein
MPFAFKLLPIDCYDSYAYSTFILDRLHVVLSTHGGCWLMRRVFVMKWTARLGGRLACGIRYTTVSRQKSAPSTKTKRENQVQPCNYLIYRTRPDRLLSVCLLSMMHIALLVPSTLSASSSTSILHLDAVVCSQSASGSRYWVSSTMPPLMQHAEPSSPLLNYLL